MSEGWLRTPATVPCLLGRFALSCVKIVPPEGVRGLFPRRLRRMLRTLGAREGHTTTKKRIGWLKLVSVELALDGDHFDKRSSSLNNSCEEPQKGKAHTQLYTIDASLCKGKRILSDYGERSSEEIAVRPWNGCQ